MLPIEPALPALREALAALPRAVLEAPPGAGKTTRVPLALLDEPWLAGGRILMLEPRRLATRAAARRMALTHGDGVGQTVGYRVRNDSRVGPSTRIEVVTEGILTRMLQQDPSMAGVGLVIFDEFHERNLPSDLGLALALESQEALRPDLRILVMSATLDGARVAEMLDPARVIRSEGRLHPVVTHHLDRPMAGRVEDAVAATVREALREYEEGDVLVFLPGTAEIRRTEERLGGLPDHVDVRPLHGALPPEAQDAAIAPSPAGRRKVVLSTDIAETSLTIEGVRVVIDSGFARRPRFDPGSGMERLETIRIARDSADQRRGRAGRTAPGACYRLWTAFEDRHLADSSLPEIVQADLAPLALELAAWGTDEPSTLRWLDPPPAAAFEEARALLADLGAVDADGRITAHGREMNSLGLHPRIAHLVLSGQAAGLGLTAIRIAALLQERDILIGGGPEPPPADIRLRLDLLAGDRHTAAHLGVRVHRGGLVRCREEVQRLTRRLRPQQSSADAEAAGLLLAFAYPDRIAQQIGTARFRLRNGHPADLTPADPLADAPFLVAAHLGGRGTVARIFLAAPLSREDIESHISDQIERTERVFWDEEAATVRAIRQERIGAVVLGEAPLRTPDPSSISRALLEGILEQGLDGLPWTKETRQLRERMVFLHHLESEAWPDVSEHALIETASEWLLPYLAGMRRLDDLRRLELAEALLSLIDWSRRVDLDRLAPTHLEVPSGSRVRIDYADPESPVLAVRLQELFGMTETPRLAGGRAPLTVHLLSPAHRPVQVTQDLASFWRDTYFEVRKDLRGRYPKHHWPEDPLSAEPTSKAKRRR